MDYGGPPPNPADERRWGGLSAYRSTPSKLGGDGARRTSQTWQALTTAIATEQASVCS